jgi:hypothetical protein
MGAQAARTLECMNSSERSLGTRATFLLPSLKLKGRTPDGQTFEHSVHKFLLAHFDGYRATSSNLFGYWKEPGGNDSDGEHRQFSVAPTEKRKGRRP